MLVGMVQNFSNVYASYDSFNLRNLGKGNYFGECKNFKIFADSCGLDGVYAGGNHSVVIYSKENCGYQISDVKLDIVGGTQHVPEIMFTSGTLDTSMLDSHSAIWINNIESPFFRIGGGSDNIQISKITVFDKTYNGNDYFEAELWPDEAFEVIEFNNDSTASSDNFFLESSLFDSDGWSSKLSIKAKENSGLKISKLEAEIGHSPQELNKVSVSSGTIIEDPISAIIFNKFHIEDIHSTELEFSISNYLFGIKNIKVYYEEDPDYTASIIASGNIWIVVVAVVIIAIGAIFFFTKKKKAKQS